jgi:hypothetical protein
MADNATPEEAEPLNIVKCREDPVPVVLKKHSELADDGGLQLTLVDDGTSSWVKTGEAVGPDMLRPRIEPWLTALCQSEHLSLLLGSGLPNAIHRLATGALLPGMAAADFGDENALITARAKESAEAANREPGNLEDQLRVAIGLHCGLEILGHSGAAEKARAETLKKVIADAIANLAGSVLQGEKGVLDAADEKRNNAFNYLVSFLMSFASRTGTRDRLHVFTTNYDRFIEAGAEVAGLHLLDRFVGSVAPIFRSSRLDLDLHYNPPGIRGEPRYLEGVARFTKLHGSLDWIDHKGNICRLGMPFGIASIESYLTAVGRQKVDAMRLMIYPNAAKDRETALYPYVELFRDFAAAICRPNHTLVAFGYSFGDEHINRVIEDMLTIPSAHLVVMSYDDPLNRIMKTYERLGRHAQITLLVGDHVGDFEALVDHYLPKPAIDRTTFRMAELLRARWATKQQAGERDSSDSDQGQPR